MGWSAVAPPPRGWCLAPSRLCQWWLLVSSGFGTLRCQGGGGRNEKGARGGPGQGVSADRPPAGCQPVWGQDPSRAWPRGPKARPGRRVDRTGTGEVGHVSSRLRAWVSLSESQGPPGPLLSPADLLFSLLAHSCRHPVLSLPPPAAPSGAPSARLGAAHDVRCSACPHRASIFSQDMSQVLTPRGPLRVQEAGPGSPCLLCAQTIVEDTGGPGS